MENENIVTIQFKFTRDKALLLMALFFLCWQPRVLNSETLTLTTYYPAPYGGYVSLMTTGQTLLARDGGNVGVGMGSGVFPTQRFQVNPPGANTFVVDSAGNVGYGTANPSGRMDLRFPTSGGMQVSDNSAPDTQSYAPFGVTRSASGADQAYIGLTKQGTYPWAIGVAGNNRMIIGASEAGTKIIRSPLFGVTPAGLITDVCRTQAFSYGAINSCTGANERVIAQYGTGNCYAGLLFLGGNVNDGSRWIPHYEQGCSGTMLCCKIADY